MSKTSSSISVLWQDIVSSFRINFDSAIYLALILVSFILIIIYIYKHRKKNSFNLSNASFDIVSGVFSGLTGLILLLSPFSDKFKQFVGNLSPFLIIISIQISIKAFETVSATLKLPED